MKLLIKMITIPVTFNYNKYKNFPPYRERWLEMIDARFGSNVKYDLTIEGHNNISNYSYDYISFEALKMVINKI